MDLLGFETRAGLRVGKPEAGFAKRIVWIVLAIYSVSFFAFYPRTLVNDDESHYQGQARLLLEGTTTRTRTDPLTDDPVEYHPDPYPLGNAAAMAPFIAIGGWRAGFMVTFLSFVLGVAMLARWLEEEGYSPLFALLIVGYPPALVMGRVCMSDVPSVAIIVGGLWLFWRGIGRGWGCWLASGFVAGGSMVFRESNPIIFAPFFAGAVLRGERNMWALVVGGLAGLCLRLASNAILFGEPFAVKAGYLLALDTIGDRLPVYLLAMLVFVPGGLVMGMLYRGRRWPELIIVVAGFFAAYVIQQYYTFATSTFKRLIITPRYLLPLVPVIAFGMAESVPRTWRALLARSSEDARARLEAWGPRLVTLWLAGVTLMAFAVHPTFSFWSNTQADIRDALAENVPADEVLITNYMATRKFIDDVGRNFTTVNNRDVVPADAESMVDRYGTINVAFLDRTDSLYWREDIPRTEEFLANVKREKTLVLDERLSSTDRLRIWRVRGAASP